MGKINKLKLFIILIIPLIMVYLLFSFYYNSLLPFTSNEIRGYFILVNFIIYMLISYIFILDIPHEWLLEETRELKKTKLEKFNSELKEELQFLQEAQVLQEKIRTFKRNLK